MDLVKHPAPSKLSCQLLTSYNVAGRYAVEGSVRQHYESTVRRQLRLSCASSPHSRLAGTSASGAALGEESQNDIGDDGRTTRKAVTGRPRPQAAPSGRFETPTNSSRTRARRSQSGPLRTAAIPAEQPLGGPEHSERCRVEQFMLVEPGVGAIIQRESPEDRRMHPAT